ncbi:MAG: LysR substrate-binding domain-containing protein [Pseudomonadota bacterium]
MEEIDLQALRVFAAVARRRSFARAAEELDSHPSSVSRTVARLEGALDVRLFQRTTRSVSLTEAGTDYLARISNVLEALDEANDALRSSDGASPGGLLRLTASVAFGERMIVPLLAGFRERYPMLQLELLLTDATVDLIEEQIDLAVRLVPQVTGNLVVTRLFSTRYRIVASPAYLARQPAIHRPEALAAHACVTMSLPGHRSEWRVRPAGEPQHTMVVPIRSAIAVSSALSLRSLALGGLGPALLADWLIADALADGRLVDLFPQHEATATDFETAAWLAYPNRAYLPQKVRVAIDYLKEHLR